MRTIRAVLRLKWQCDLSNRDIAASCRICETAVRDYLHRAQQAGLSWPIRQILNDPELKGRFFLPQPTMQPQESGKRSASIVDRGTAPGRTTAKREQQAGALHYGSSLC